MDDAGRRDALRYPVKLAGRQGRAEHPFRLEPDAGARARLAEDLDLLALRKLRFHGRLVPEGSADWRLEATLGATVVQPCVATLAPVTTRIDIPVRRSYRAEMPDLPPGDEIEMPEDDSLEPLPATLDLGAVMVEELALSLPLYPHVDNAGPVEKTFSAPGVTPMTDDEAKPLAALAALKRKLPPAED